MLPGDHSAEFAGSPMPGWAGDDLDVQFNTGTRFFAAMLDQAAVAEHGVLGGDEQVRDRHAIAVGAGEGITGGHANGHD